MKHNVEMENFQRYQLKAQKFDAMHDCFVFTTLSLLLFKSNKLCNHSFPIPPHIIAVLT